MAVFANSPPDRDLLVFKRKTKEKATKCTLSYRGGGHASQNPYEKVRDKRYPLHLCRELSIRRMREQAGWRQGIQR